MAPSRRFLQLLCGLWLLGMHSSLARQQDQQSVMDDNMDTDPERDLAVTSKMFFTTQKAGYKNNKNNWHNNFKVNYQGKKSDYKYTSQGKNPQGKKSDSSKYVNKFPHKNYFPHYGKGYDSKSGKKTADTHFTGFNYQLLKLQKKKQPPVPPPKQFVKNTGGGLYYHKAKYDLQFPKTKTIPDSTKSGKKDSLFHQTFTFPGDTKSSKKNSYFYKKSGGKKSKSVRGKGKGKGKGGFAPTFNKSPFNKAPFNKAPFNKAPFKKAPAAPSVSPPVPPPSPTFSSPPVPAPSPTFTAPTDSPTPLSQRIFQWDTFASGSVFGGVQAFDDSGQLLVVGEPIPSVNIPVVRVFEVVVATSTLSVPAPKSGTLDPLGPLIEDPTQNATSNFGSSVDACVNAATGEYVIVVGCSNCFDDSSGGFFIYAYDKDLDTWVLQASSEDLGNFPANSRAGTSVAIAGDACDAIIVGAPGKDGTGSAIIYEFDGQLTQTFDLSGGNAGDECGQSVAITKTNDDVGVVAGCPGVNDDIGVIAMLRSDPVEGFAFLGNVVGGSAQGDRCGESVDTTAGSSIAASAPYFEYVAMGCPGTFVNGVGEDTGIVRVLFLNDDLEWTPFIPDIEGASAGVGTGSTLALDPNSGTEVALVVGVDDQNFQEVVVFDFSSGQALQIGQKVVADEFDFDSPRPAQVSLVTPPGFDSNPQLAAGFQEDLFLKTTAYVLNQVDGPPVPNSPSPVVAPSIPPPSFPPVESPLPTTSPQPIAQPITGPVQFPSAPIPFQPPSVVQPSPQPIVPPSVSGPVQMPVAPIPFQPPNQAPIRGSPNIRPPSDAAPFSPSAGGVFPSFASPEAFTLTQSKESRPTAPVKYSQQQQSAVYAGPEDSSEPAPPQQTSAMFQQFND